MKYFVWFVKNRSLFNLSAVAAAVKIDKSTLQKAINRNLQNPANGLSEEDAAKFEGIYRQLTAKPKLSPVVGTGRPGRRRKNPITETAETAEA